MNEANLFNGILISPNFYEDADLNGHNLRNVDSIYDETNNIAINLNNGTGQIKLYKPVLIDNDLQVNGTLTSIQATNLEIKDSNIKLADGNAADLVDSGIYMTYNDGSQRNAGLFRDHDDDRFKLYKNLTVEPTTTVNTGHATFTYADLVAGGLVLQGVLQGNSTGTNSLKGTLDMNVNDIINVGTLLVSNNTGLSGFLNMNTNPILGITNLTMNGTLTDGTYSSTSGVFTGINSITATTGTYTNHDITNQIHTRREAKVTQAIVSNTDTAVFYPTAVIAQGISPITYASGVFTIKQAGIYQISTDIFWQNNNVGIRNAYFRCSEEGDRRISYIYNDANTSNELSQNLSMNKKFALNETIQVRVLHNSTTNPLNISGNTAAQYSEIFITKIS